MDPPRHGAWRAIFNGAITWKTPDAMESFVRSDVNAHIDAFIERGTCDLVRELAEPVPAETICRLVGIDDALVPKVRETALAMFAAQGNPEEFGRRQAAFAEVTVAEVHARRRQPRDDYLTRSRVGRGRGQGARRQRLRRPAGRVSRRRSPQHDLRDREPRLRGVLEAAIRDALSGRSGRRSSVQSRRHCVCGRRSTVFAAPPGMSRCAAWGIPAECDVYMGWAAANRDPEMFAAPTEFRVDRGANRHLSFGFGVHTCPGAPLARMELRVVLEELLRRLPDLRVQGEPPEYCFGGGDYVFVDSLPVSFTPGKPEGTRPTR